jgi:DNA repair protein RadD
MSEADLLPSLHSDLRPYQAEAIARIEQALARGVRRILLQAATGSGKTRIASTIATRARAQCRRVLFVVPAVELVDQTVERFFRGGLDDVGVIQASHWMTNYSKPVQVASVQTLMRRELPRADLVFIDEAHRWYDFYRRWFLDPRWSDVPFIGLSATPWTKGLGAYYRELIVAATTRQLIDAGYLSPFRVFAPAHPDLKGVRTVGGDFHEGDLGDAMDRQPLVADIVETWRKHGVGRPSLCFAVNRAHAQHIVQRFEESGVRAGYIDCNTQSNERTDIRRKFALGQYEVVVNVGVLTLGVDWDVRCIILARPTKSEMLFVQIIGRGLRLGEGKDHCLILDHSDTTLRLGFVTDIHHETLDYGKTRASHKRDSIKLPKECSNCACLRPVSTPTCPNWATRPSLSTRSSPSMANCMRCTLTRRASSTESEFTANSNPSRGSAATSPAGRGTNSLSSLVNSHTVWITSSRSQHRRNFSAGSCRALSPLPRRRGQHRDDELAGERIARVMAGCGERETP